MSNAPVNFNVTNFCWFWPPPGKSQLFCPASFPQEIKVRLIYSTTGNTTCLEWPPRFRFKLKASRGA